MANRPVALEYFVIVAPSVGLVTEKVHCLEIRDVLQAEGLVPSLVRAKDDARDRVADSGYIYTLSGLQETRSQACSSSDHKDLCASRLPWETRRNLSDRQ